jgi:hypothetical protein
MRLLVERTVTVNTTASGGNASLLSLEEAEPRKVGSDSTFADEAVSRFAAHPAKVESDPTFRRNERR